MPFLKFNDSQNANALSTHMGNVDIATRAKFPKAHLVWVGTNHCLDIRDSARAGAFLPTRN
jgi:hypothetical protein